MPRLIMKYSLIIVIIIAVALIGLSIVTSGERNRLTGLESIIGDVITPIQGFMYRTATGVSDYINSIKERRELAKNYQKLIRQVDRMERELLDYDELKKENDRLKSLLNFEKNDELFVAGAHITGKDPGGWFNVFTVDKGSDDNIKVNSAVVTDKGLIGRVIDVGKNWSKVRAIVDGKSSVSGIVERTRDHGMVRGNNGLTYEDGLCRMVHLPIDSDIIVGDKIITSGLGEIYPKGIYIGEVIDVVQEKRDLYKTAIIKPGADFRRLEEVLIVYTAQE